MLSNSVLHDPNILMEAGEIFGRQTLSICLDVKFNYRDDK